ncbi:MAG TPA: zinc metallopeptidase [Kiritimatiellia bacterium]|nr:zinc metallopeptidase [Kiritimatiellia bacterium]HMO98738.1 zinc metallopeptidase [Kiritimatiellia bacterium]HMP95914.1 zinc metallopeptidase [Kiritimatiellia bacterium]
MILDPLYFIFALPGLILALLATMRVKSTFHKYSRYAASSGLTGAQAARRMLQAEGITDVNIEMTQGFLSDHYDPRSNTLRLSPDVYNSPSLAAIGVACHEAGHALQKAHDYAPLTMRSALVPLTSFGSQLAMPIFVVGMMAQIPFLLTLGIWLFIGVVAFALVTLPVEWDASARAKQQMVRAGIVAPQEQVHAAKVLNAAFLTYVASAVSAILTLAYLLFVRDRH